MRNWIACSTFSILFLSLPILLIAPLEIVGQSITPPSVEDPYHNRYYSAPTFASGYQVQDTTEEDLNPNLPDPNSVLYKSMIIPGWGQIVNKQAWKVPIIYGILGGLGYYSVHLHKKYHDYRAAYYNLNPENENDDLRFGPTPSYIPENANLEQIRTQRNTFRNRRDLVYVGLALAYGLNIIDAYVFAHMRSFDVSEDLSMRPSIKPKIMTYSTPGITLSIDLIKK